MSASDLAMSALPALGVIPAPALARHKADAALLRGAQQRAAEIVTQAQAQAQQLRQQAHAAGLAQARQEALLQQLQQAQQMAQWRDAICTQAADILLQALAHVLDGPARQDYLQGFLAPAQQTLGRLQFARVLVHPADEATLRAVLARPGVATAGSLGVECDPALQPGDCALVSEAGKVAVSLQARLQDVQQVLQQVLAEAAPRPPA
jgi:flagellar biosynthesis/type III secretory pathway protein FliH